MPAGAACAHLSPPTTAATTPRLSRVSPLCCAGTRNHHSCAHHHFAPCILLLTMSILSSLPLFCTTTLFVSSMSISGSIYTSRALVFSTTREQQLQAMNTVARALNIIFVCLGLACISCPFCGECNCLHNIVHDGADRLPTLNSLCMVSAARLRVCILHLCVQPRNSRI